MEQVAAIEKEHETRYRKLWENIKTQQVFARDSEVTWICGSCGRSQRQGCSGNLPGLPSRPRVFSDQGGELLVDCGQPRD
ncbi:MAG: hypothetical protein V8R50_04245 [Clostridia bacterium]